MIFVSTAVIAVSIGIGMKDDLLIEMPSLETLLCRGRFCHSRHYRREPAISSLHQNQSGDTRSRIEDIDVTRNHQANAHFELLVVSS
jgi:hypothetical protein